ncbi:MAG: gfo/Idh/MocA family oxidoreductase [Bacteroidetes bacterium]|nr:gfo/Idh/MocA family oxidoreductase [Bacteroidota bacterium]
MSDHLNKKVLLIGTTPIAIDHWKVLNALGCETVVVGQGQQNAALFEKETGVKVHVGGVEKFIAENSLNDFDSALVSVGAEKLKEVTIALLNKGLHKILLEKPGGLNRQEMEMLAAETLKHKATVLLAYNRRFYASVLAAEEIIAKDGGVKSLQFEFTEWSHQLDTLPLKEIVKRNWIYAGSTHPIDLAFYFGGKPKEMKSFSAGKLAWHDKSIFYGAGKTEKDVLFSYAANWAAPGRWVVEILTNNYRLYFKPMEQLHIQNKGSVAVNKVEIDDSLDVQYKAGLYLQAKAFLEGNHSRFLTIAQQAEMAVIYEQMLNGN